MAAPDLYEKEPSLGALFSELTAATRTLLRQEIELAKAELSEKAARKGKDAALMAAGGIVAYTGALVLLAAVVIGLGNLMGYGWAALLVGVLVAGAGAAMIMAGRNDMRQSTLSPDRTKRSIKETKLWLKEQRR